jgi:hypothetical protein
VARISCPVKFGADIPLTLSELTVSVAMDVVASTVVPVAVKLPVARLEVVAFVPVALVKNKFAITEVIALSRVEKRFVVVAFVIVALLKTTLEEFTTIGA